jgi:hypothetical protein
MEAPAVAPEAGVETPAFLPQVGTQAPTSWSWSS